MKHDFCLRVILKRKENEDKKWCIDFEKDMMSELGTKLLPVNDVDLFVGQAVRTC